MDLGGCDGAGPAQAELVVGLLGDGGHGARDADAVGTHRHGLGLAVLVEHGEAERLGVLAAELEDVAHLEALLHAQAAAALRADIVRLDLGRLDRPVGDEVPPGDEVDHVVAGLVRAGDPPGAVHHARVEQVADSRRVLLSQRTGPDVALHERGVGREVRLLERLGEARCDLGLEPLHVELAVAREADGEGRELAVGGAHVDDHVLERVGRNPRPVAAGEALVDECDERVDGRRVGRVLDPGRWRVGPIDGGRYHGDDGFDVGCVAATRALDERVLADRARVDELLAGRSAHRPGCGRHDDNIEAESLERVDVHPAVERVAGRESVVVDVEGVRVLHQELAATQDAGAGAGLVAVLRLDLEQHQRQVLVRRVQVLDHEGEHLLVRRAEEIVVVAAVLESEEVVAVVGPASGALVGLAGKQRGEADLLEAGLLHLLANDGLDFVQHLQAERQPRVDPRRSPAHVSGPDQEPMARYLGVVGVVSQSPQERGGEAQHGR